MMSAGALLVLFVDMRQISRNNVLNNNVVFATASNVLQHNIPGS